MSHPPYWYEARQYLSARDEVLGRIISSYNEHEFLRSRGNAFETLLRSIVGQQISVRAADAIWGRLAALCQINATAILHLPEDALRQIGLSGQKTCYVRELAGFFAGGQGKNIDFRTLSAEQTREMLINIKGIGHWTVDMFLIFHVMHPDILPIADIGLLSAVGRHYNISTPYKDQKFIPILQDIAKNWQPYCTVATWYMWRSLDPIVVEY